MNILHVIMTKREYTLQNSNCHNGQLYSHATKPLVYIANQIQPKVAIGFFRQFVTFLNDMKITHAIVIYEQDITTSVKESVKDLSSKLDIEFFSTDELLFDITEHFLQPIFTLLSASETDQVYKKYGKIGFPIMLYADPIRKFFGWSRGSLIKVEPRDKRTMYYRIVR